MEELQKAYEMKKARDEERLAYIRRMNKQPQTAEVSEPIQNNNNTLFFFSPLERESTAFLPFHSLLALHI